LVQKIYGTYAAGCADILDTHGEAAGASLGFRKEAYLAVGGFDSVKCGEDRQIIRASRASGRAVRHAEDVSVHASCRLIGRAVGGMSDALKARVTGTDYLVDDCLHDAKWIVKNAGDGTLGVWPPQVPDANRVHVADLPRNISILQKFLNSRRRPIGPVLSASTQAKPEAHHRGPLASDRGSAVVPADPTFHARPPGAGRLNISN
ncbi:MAG: hypothetical protein WBB25_15335, partial [Sulfitobacter sp.]